MAKNSKPQTNKLALGGPDDLLFELDTVQQPQYEKGQYREYLLTSTPEYITKSRTVSGKEYVLLGLLFVAGLYVRLQNLGHPNSVVFDEVHFGGFAKKYIKGAFFMDVHPPLAKMLFAAVGLLAGFKGDFSFTHIGDVFPDSVPYVVMRAFPAVLGLATVFLCYLTLRASGVRPIVAFTTAGALLVENSFVTISRYILLDSPLVFFIAAAIYAFKKFEVQQPFSLNYFRSLLLCSLALGMAFSSKWVGLFTIAWVGICCVIHMWFLIGDLSVSPKAVWKHAFSRASFLLGVPIALYLFVFSIHFNVLTNDGDGSAFMTSGFRAGLAGSLVPRQTTAQVGYGSLVSIRHVNTRGGYLHSHNHMYPTGSKQQQITLYPHLDTNNEWLIEPYNRSIPAEFVQLKDGDKVRLVHVNTKRRLHSHDEKPPVSERDWQKEVSCYGYDGFGGDANDDWIFEVVKHKTKGRAQKEIRSIETIFRLRHAMTGHYLFSSETKLPGWGFEQQEVSAAGQGARPLTHWYIETNNAEQRLPADQREIARYQPLSFWEKLIESHKTMWKINQGLTSHHNWQSSPQDWPLLLRGINYWGKNHTQVYFLGNPVVWWTASAALVAFIIHAGISVLKWQVGKLIAGSKDVYHFNYHVFTYFLGWFIHYAPFFIMGRQLFLHHYLPSQYFAILSLGHLFELLVSSSFFGRKGANALVAYLGAAATIYFYFSPLIYGNQWTKSKCASTKWVSSWDYDCNTFLDNAAQYKSLESSVAQSTLSNPLTVVVNEAKETPRAVKQEAQKEQQELEVESFEEPPAAETHKGPLPDFLRDDEEAPVGELVDEATGNKGEPQAVPEDPAPSEGDENGVVADDVVVEDVVVEEVAQPVN